MCRPSSEGRFSTTATSLVRSTKSCINAAAHLNGMNYSTLISGLKKQGVEVNRKMLADLAVNDAEGFAQLAQIAKKA